MRVHAYGLMSNHFHLQIETPQANLRLNRYIHLNPVRLESLDLGKQRQAEIRQGVEDVPEESLVTKRLALLRSSA